MMRTCLLIWIFLIVSGTQTVTAQQHLLPVKKNINEANYTIAKSSDDKHWQTLEDGGYFTVKGIVSKIDIENGQRRLLQLRPERFEPKGNYTIEFKIKVQYVSEKGRGFDISVYDGLKAFDFNITEKQLTDYGVNKIFTETDFSKSLRTIRFAVERYVGIVHIYIDEIFVASYIMRKPTTEKFLKIGKGQSSSAAVIELTSFYVDFNGAFRPN